MRNFSGRMTAPYFREMNDHQTHPLRAHLAALLNGGRAFASPEKILADVPVSARGVRPDGIDHSRWELLEHLRRDQRDMLEVARGAEPKSPAELWPPTTEPPTASAWDESVRAFLDDLDELRGIAANSAIDLLAIIPPGPTMTWMGVIIVNAEHNAYHLGQFTMLRKMLGVWG